MSALSELPNSIHPATFKGRHLQLQEEQRAINAKLEKKRLEHKNRQEILTRMAETGQQGKKDEVVLNRNLNKIKQEEQKKARQYNYFQSQIVKVQESRDALLRGLDADIKKYEDAIERKQREKQTIIDQKAVTVQGYETDIKNLEEAFEAKRDSIEKEIDTVSGPLSIDTDKVLMRLAVEIDELEKSHLEVGNQWHIANEFHTDLMRKTREETYQRDVQAQKQREQQERHIALERLRIQQEQDRREEEEKRKRRLEEREDTLRSYRAKGYTEEEALDWYKRGVEPPGKKSNSSQAVVASPKAWRMEWVKQFTSEQKAIWNELALAESDPYREEFYKLDSKEKIDDLFAEWKDPVEKILLYQSETKSPLNKKQQYKFMHIGFERQVELVEKKNLKESLRYLEAIQLESTSDSESESVEKKQSDRPPIITNTKPKKKSH